MVTELDTDLLDSIVARLVEPIAKRVVEMIQEQGMLADSSPSNAWLDAAGVAQRLGVTREWVYEHADELGAVRIGSGCRPRLRFPSKPLPRSEPGPRAKQEQDATSGQRNADGMIPIYDG